MAGKPAHGDSIAACRMPVEDRLPVIAKENRSAPALGNPGRSRLDAARGRAFPAWRTCAQAVRSRYPLPQGLLRAGHPRAPRPTQSNDPDAYGRGDTEIDHTPARARLDRARLQHYHGFFGVVQPGGRTQARESGADHGKVGISRKPPAPETKSQLPMGANPRTRKSVLKKHGKPTRAKGRRLG